MPGDTAGQARVNKSRATDGVEKTKITASYERDFVKLAAS